MFSVVIPTRDRADMVVRTIEAVLSQTKPAQEVIVIDDGSEDDTPTVLGRFDGLIRVGRLDGRGVASARNAGARLAQGEFVIFLDDDDIPVPTWLEEFHRAVTAETGIACCGVEIQEGDGEVRLLLPRPTEHEAVSPFLPGTFAVRRWIFESVGGYLDGLTYGENSELAFRLFPACRDARLVVTSIELPLLRMRRARVRRSIAGRRHAVLAIVAQHPALFASDPKRLSRWLSIAGVDAWRDGDHMASRAILWQAARVSPTAARPWARLAVSWMPFAANKVWRATPRSPTA